MTRNRGKPGILALGPATLAGRIAADKVFNICASPPLILDIAPGRADAHQRPLTAIAPLVV